MKEDNLKVIYEEISELHRFQQSSVDLLYNKLNWVLVSDLVFIAALVSSKNGSILALLLASLSAILALIEFQPHVFQSTAQISDQLERAAEPNFMESLIKKKKEAYHMNAERLESLNTTMLYTRIFLLAALILQFLSMISPFFFYGFH